MGDREQERWVSRHDVAEHAGVSLDTVDKWVREGCPSVKTGDGKSALRRFRLSEVDNWLVGRGAVEPEPEAAA